MNRPMILTLIVSCSLALSGCVFLLGAGAGASGYSYIRGELCKNYPAGMNAAWSASLKALKNLSLKVQEKHKDGLGGKIRATRADGSKVVLNFKMKDEGVVTIGVRVGVFGKKSASEKIHEKIGRYLKR